MIQKNGNVALAMTVMLVNSEQDVEQCHMGLAKIARMDLIIVITQAVEVGIYPIAPFNAMMTSSK
jgi:hypothetical protein